MELTCSYITVITYLLKKYTRTVYETYLAHARTVLYAELVCSVLVNSHYIIEFIINYDLIRGKCVAYVGLYFFILWSTIYRLTGYILCLIEIVHIQLTIFIMCSHFSPVTLNYLFPLLIRHFLKYRFCDYRVHVSFISLTFHIILALTCLLFN